MRNSLPPPSQDPCSFDQETLRRATKGDGSLENSGGGQETWEQEAKKIRERNAEVGTMAND